MTTSTPSSRPTGPPIVRRPFRTPVRGHAFATPPPRAARLAPGQPAWLRREPANPADPSAVGVWVRDPAGWWRIGYLDRHVAARLAPVMDRGRAIRAEVAGWTDEPEGRWRRPLLQVAAQDARPWSGQQASTRAAPPSPRGAGLWGRPPGTQRRRVDRPAER
jgi:hypothetical protein